MNNAFSTKFNKIKQNRLINKNDIKFECVTSFMNDHGFSFRDEESFQADFEEFFRRSRFRLSNDSSFPDGHVQTPRSKENKYFMKTKRLSTTFILLC